MTDIPVEINIGDLLYKRLMAQQDKMVAVQQSMEMFQRNCEQRISEHQAATRDIWEEIRQLNPDVAWERVAYVPSKTPGYITPIQMKLGDA